MRMPSSSAALLIAILASPSFAADQVIDAPVERAGFNWSGAYVGATVGYGWGDNTYFYEDEFAEFDVDGFVAGATAGYNWQHGQFVLGVEADISYSDISGGVLLPPTGAPCFVEGCTADVNWFGTGRVRLGYAFENFLPFVTGGVAVGGVEGSADVDACAAMVAVCGYDETRWGWAAGGGVEWGLTEKLSFKAEYLHVNLGSPGFSTLSPFPNTSDIDFDTVRFGANFHF
jgi:outer membrane immunogenic protein